MRNFTRKVALLLLGASLPMVSTLAQNDPEPGTSFTDRIQNPSYDAGNSDGWTITGATAGFQYGTIEVYNSGFDCYQTISGLPAGTYQLTATGFRRVAGNDGGAAYNAHTEVINMFLYARTSLREKRTPFLSLYSVTGLEAPEEGWAPNLNGFVNNMFAANWAFEQGYYKDNTVNGIAVGEDGTLTIGVKTVGDNLGDCWSIWDDFNLIYTGAAGLEVYTDAIEELEGLLGQYNSDTEVPSGNYNEIQDVLAYTNDNAQSSDVLILQSVIDSLTNVLARAEMVAPVMSELNDLAQEAWYYITLDYPGKEALNAAYEETINLMSFGAQTEEGNYVFIGDLNAGKMELESAIRTYRFNEPIEDPTIGIDFTWAMQSPNFTRLGGDPANAADGTSVGWETNNVYVGSDFKLNTINNKNCWNNWSNNFTSMDVFQLLEGMPAGLYTFSCYQTNDGPEVTDQHAYITALGGTANSPAATYTFATDLDGGNFAADSKWEGPLQTEKILVGVDGKIRVGFASTSNKNGSSGWFCITDCSLRYYGPGSYEEAMAGLIESAELVLNEEMLATDNVALAAAIATAKTVDASDPQEAEAGMAALNEAITAAKDGINALAAFKAGSFAKGVEIAENTEMLYAEEIAELLAGIVNEQNLLLESDTITSASYPVMTSTLDQYISYVDAYSKCEEFALAQEDPEIQSLISSVMSEQTRIVSNDGSKIEAAKVQFTAIESFVNAYLLGMDFSINEEYPEEMRADLATTCSNQFDAVGEDHSKASAATATISKALGDMRFAGLGLEPGEETEVTSVVIKNPDLEVGNVTTGNSGEIPEGWTIVRINGDKNTTTNQHWSGNPANRYLDSWNAAAGVVKFTPSQEIKGIPNGKYRLVAAVRSSGAGAYLFAQSGGEMNLAEIPVNNDKNGGIWEAAEEGSEIKLVNNGIGFGWDWLEIANINVNDNTLTIGTSSDQEFTGGVAWTGFWYSSDDYQLFWTSADFDDSVENIGLDSTSELVAYSENGYITVVGAEEYTIYTLDGTEVPANAQLAAGIYIVKAANKITKVAVK